jgi:16S rRNA (guanine966-N2)-methyltransferase
MRIISGIYKGRKVKFPNSKLVRPTTDRIKESLFNYFTNFIDFENIKVLDIYAGSGSLGLEALSRGASTVHFIEKNFKIFKVLQENVKSLDENGKCRVFKTDAVNFSRNEPKNQYDLILADPPFYKYDIHTVASNLLEKGFLTDEGFMFIERSKQTEEKDIDNFKKEPIKRIGDSLIYRFP